MRIILKVLLNALALILTSYLLNNRFIVDGLGAALLAAILLGVVNTFIRPILLFLTAPINLLTLGLFTFVINAILLRIVAVVVPGFTIDSWLSAILAAVVLSVISTALSMLLRDLKLK